MVHIVGEKQPSYYRKKFGIRTPRQKHRRRDANIWRLWYDHNMSVAEIAEKKGLSASGVNKIIARERAWREGTADWIEKAKAEARAQRALDERVGRYRQRGRSIKWICTKLGLNLSQVYECWRRFCLSGL